MIKRWFEVVTKDGECVAEDDLPDRKIGKRWDPKWKKLGYKKEIVLFELIKSETTRNGHVLTFACPGPFTIKFPRPRGQLGMAVDHVLDRASEPDGAVKLVADGGAKAKMMH